MLASQKGRSLGPATTSSSSSKAPKQTRLDAFFTPLSQQQEQKQEAAIANDTSPDHDVPPTQEPRLSDEQQAILDTVLRDRNSVFVTGSAGTGKSRLLRAIIAALRKEYARTPGLYDMDKLIRFIKTCRPAHRRWKAVRVLVIDEVSMVDGRLLDTLAAQAKGIAIRSSEKCCLWLSLTRSKASRNGWSLGTSSEQRMARAICWRDGSKSRSKPDGRRRMCVMRRRRCGEKLPECWDRFNQCQDPCDVPWSVVAEWGRHSTYLLGYVPVQYPNVAPPPHRTTSTIFCFGVYSQHRTCIQCPFWRRPRGRASPHSRMMAQPGVALHCWLAAEAPGDICQTSACLEADLAQQP